MRKRLLEFGRKTDGLFTTSIDKQNIGDNESIWKANS
jgi:hypothetical protein